MNNEQRELARHALGLPNRRNESYRNHFCAGEGHSDYENWMLMVDAGEAIRFAPREISGGDATFCMTSKGALAAREPKEHISREDMAVMRGWDEQLEIKARSAASSTDEGAAPGGGK